MKHSVIERKKGDDSLKETESLILSKPPKRYQCPIHYDTLKALSAIKYELDINVFNLEN